MFLYNEKIKDIELMWHYTDYLMIKRLWLSIKDIDEMDNDRYQYYLQIMNCEIKLEKKENEKYNKKK